MTKFSVLPPLGSTVILGGRIDILPTAEFMETIREVAKPFYPWYRLCPGKGDIITVDTRHNQKFFVEDANSAHSRDRWICRVREIVAVDKGVLIFGSHFQWTVTLPGSKLGSSDECTIAEVEIIDQAKSVYMLVGSLPP